MLENPHEYGMICELINLMTEFKQKNRINTAAFFEHPCVKGLGALGVMDEVAEAAWVKLFDADSKGHLKLPRPI